jgi:hypothetical protein
MTRLAERMSSPAHAVAVVTASAIDQAPTTDDELYGFVTDRLGLVMPREANCDDHDAPFRIFADAYFGRETNQVVIAPREGGKSTMTAALHLCNALFRPGFWGVILGAQDDHAKGIYSIFQQLVCRHGGLEGNDAEKHPLVVKSLISETVFTNGSRVEISPATLGRVNGPHPNLLSCDEAELVTDDQVFQDSRHMSTSMADDFPGIDLITSTRKSAIGRMQQLVDEHDNAVAHDFDPPFTIRRWCFKDSGAAVANCRMAPENASRPEDELCQCQKIRKGAWEGTNEPRTFDQVCGGDLFRATGHTRLHDFHKKFRASSLEVWNAQQECSHPYTSRAVLPRFSRARHCVTAYVPDPQHGPIFMGLDLGDGPNHSHAVWIQRLSQPVTTTDVHGNEKTLEEGTRVVFSEWFMAEAGNLDLHRGIVRSEFYWRQHFAPAGLEWRVRIDGRFSDVSGRTRIDLQKMDPPLRLRSLHKDVQAQLAMLIDLLDENKLVIDIGRCELLVKEIESWHRDHRGNIVKRDDHGPDALRYGLWGMKQLEAQLAQQAAMKTGAGRSPYSPGVAAGESPWKSAARRGPISTTMSGGFSIERDGTFENFLARLEREGER